MAEIVTEGIYNAAIAYPQEGGYETLLVVQPPLDIEPALWGRAITAAAQTGSIDVKQEDRVKEHGHKMINHLASTDEGSLYAIQTSPLRQPYKPDNENHFTEKILKDAVRSVLKAAMVTKGQIDLDKLDELDNEISLF
ncbi:MAG TPA: hypothetical protein VLG11_03435 [Candidatus Saccharimonadales bacterium]|nr:hypothetical protein [Candidatus Saccharimonadales bacterium]